MPIRIATIGRQKSVATLAKALFETNGSPEALARAEEALVRANPGIAAEGAIKPGMRIFVPSGSAFGPKAQADDGDGDAEPLVAVARANAAALDKLVAGSVARLIEETKKGAGEVKEVIGRLSASRPEFKELGAQIVKDAEAEAERMSQGADAVRAAIKQLTKDLPRDGLPKTGSGRLDG
jgi:hypothetical protein